MPKLPRFVKRLGAVPPLLLEETQFMRPNWGAVVEHMIRTRQDVLLVSLEANPGPAAGLYKAVRRAGYWVQTHRIDAHAMVYRLCDRSPDQPSGGLPPPKNTLPEEYALEEPEHKYGRYRVLAARLAAGETLTVPEAKSVQRLRAAMRRLYPVEGPTGAPGYPPHTLITERDPNTGHILVRCEWQTPPP
jgi:hypothetical protein